MRNRNHRRLGRFSTAALGLALTGAIGVGLMSSPALATGGVKVDDDNYCVDTNGEKATDRQANTLEAGTTGYIWLNLPQEELASSYTYILYNDNGDAVGPVALSFTQCTQGNTSYYYASFTVPSTAGTYTIKVDAIVDGSPVNVGGDAFQVIVLV
jgi:hypothetical protein